MTQSTTTTRPAWDANVNALIHAEQISMLYRQLPTSVAGNMVGALVLAGVLLGEHPLMLIVAWLACVTVLQMSRLWLHFRDNQTGFVRNHIERAAVIWAAGAGMSGALWGATALLFFVSGQHVYQAVLTVLVFGITASAVPLIRS